MRNVLEERVVDYITGAAMMEPDVRQETNKLGFCFDHYQMLMKKRNRLGVALMLESHLAELDKQVFSKLPMIGKSSRKQAKTAGKNACTCFVCQQVDWAMDRMLDTVCRLWESERDFRSLFDEQPALCLPHYSLLIETAALKISKKNISDFNKSAEQLCRKYFNELRGDVSHFFRMFDYRNNKSEADWGNSRDAIERSVWWLTSRFPK
jgi:hypothetical protein